MDFDIAPDESDFRDEVRQWLAEHLVGEFAAHRGVGSPTDDTAWDVRVAWEKELVRRRLAGPDLAEGVRRPRCVAGPGDRLRVRVRPSRGARHGSTPRRLELLGPTLLAFGTEEQKRRFLPRILSVEDIWGQGFSEPGAGSDIAAVTCRARLDGDQWVIDGQKVWTTFGHQADWLYVVCRTHPDASLRHKGLTMLLVPVDQPGVEIRPIENLAGSEEFSECFFTGARTDADLVVGDVDDGWRVVMGTLGMERGAALIPMQLAMEREVIEVIATAQALRARSTTPRIAQRLADAYIATQLMRATNLRVVSEPAARHGRGRGRGRHQQALRLGGAPAAGRAGHGRRGSCGTGRCRRRFPAG